LVWYGLNIVMCIGTAYFFAIKAVVFHHETHDEDTLLQSGFPIELVYVELFFLFDMVKQMITEYKPEGQDTYETDLTNIAHHYIWSTTFLWDFIMWFPFNFILGEKSLLKNLYLLKCFRILKALRLFNITKLMHLNKAVKDWRMGRLLAKNPEISQDTLVDHNNVSGMVLLRKQLGVLQMVLFVMNIAFFLGIFWHRYTVTVVELVRFIGDETEIAIVEGLNFYMSQME